jgi:hypothetical protein
MRGGFDTPRVVTADHKNLSRLPCYMAYLLRSKPTPLGWSCGTSGGRSLFAKAVGMVTGRGGRLHDCAAFSFRQSWQGQRRE